MVTSSALQQLAENLRETLDVEVKNWLGGLQEHTEKAKLAKEIIALGNHGGGYLFIGFSDDEGHPEIKPDTGEESGYTQDAIAAVVEKYIEPSLQIEIEKITLTGSHVVHPVLIVPGSHRTPLWAKKGSPDNQVLKNDTIYIRRPGARSEPPRSQDDWEKLIDRLVKARQTEIVNAVRNVLNPASPKSHDSPGEKLDVWTDESSARWQQFLKPLEADDPRRFNVGYWEASFSIDDFRTSTIRELNNFMRRELPSFSGWMPFLYLSDQDRGPRPLGDSIEAWLGNVDYGVSSRELAMMYYWRLGMNGNGYIVRPFYEDDPDYCASWSPRPQRPSFDRVYHAYRVAELLKIVEFLGLKFAQADSAFMVKIKYNKMLNRSLAAEERPWHFGHHGISNVDTIET